MNAISTKNLSSNKEKGPDMCLNKKREVHVLGMYKYESCTLIQAATPTLGFAIKLETTEEIIS